MEMEMIKKDIENYLTRLNELQVEIKKLDEQKNELIKEVLRIDGILVYLNNKLKELSNGQNQSN